MVTNGGPIRKVGRPTVIQDDEIFNAVYRVLTQDGPGHVTLAAVAKEVKSSGPALIKRFGSKRGLMLAFSQWAVNNSRLNFSDRPRDGVSPLKALRDSLVSPKGRGTPDEMDMREYSNIVQFYFGEALDSDLRKLWGQWTDIYEQETVRYLAEAIAAGELREDCDPKQLGHALHSAMTGIVVLWFGHPDRSYQVRLQKVFDTIILPHLRS